MYTMNHVYQIYLSNRYLYYYYSFLGEHLILADLIRWRWTKLHSDSPGSHRKHSPHHERLFLSARRVDRPSCPHQTSEINVEYYYLKTDGPSGLLQDFIVWCKRVKSTDESWRQRRWKYKSSKDNQKRLPNIFLIQKRE